MAGGSANFAGIAAVAVGRVGNYQIHAFGFKIFVNFAQIAANYFYRFFKTVIFNAALHKGGNFGVKLYPGYLFRAARRQKQAYRPCAAAKFQHLRLFTRCANAATNTESVVKVNSPASCQTTYPQPGNESRLIPLCTIKFYPPWKHPRFRPIPPEWYCPA